MIAVTRLRRPAGDDDVLARAQRALTALAAQPGYAGGVLGRSTDDPDLWVLSTRWSSVGAYRRALSAWDVKMHAHPLLYEAVDEPSAFEVLVEVDREGTVRRTQSDRAG